MAFRPNPWYSGACLDALLAPQPWSARQVDDPPEEGGAPHRSHVLGLDVVRRRLAERMVIYLPRKKNFGHYNNVGNLLF